MTCTSGSVQTVADKTTAAKDQIDKLIQMLKDGDSKNKAYFMDQITNHLQSAGIKDARQITYSSDIKTEYTTEFSLDKIANVVTSALKAAAAAQDPKCKSPAMSPEAIAAYTDVVNTVAQAAKSSSTSSSSLAFSMTRLSPGLFSFLYATSVNIKDEDTFGSEGVTSTSIYYYFAESIDDVKNQAAFDNSLIDAKNLKNMKELQASLTDQLANGLIDIDTWTKLDDKYDAAVNKIQERLAKDGFNLNAPLVLLATDGFGMPLEHSFTDGSLVAQKIVRNSILKLSKMGETYRPAIEKSESRLADNYF